MKSFSIIARETSQLVLPLIGWEKIFSFLIIIVYHRFDLCRRTAVYKSRERNCFTRLYTFSKRRDELTGGHHHSIRPKRIDTPYTHIHIWNHHRQLHHIRKFWCWTASVTILICAFWSLSRHCPGVLSLLLTDDFSSPASKTHSSSLSFSPLLGMWTYYNFIIIIISYWSASW